MFFGVSEGLMNGVPLPVWLLDVQRLHKAGAPSATLSLANRRLQCCNARSSVAIVRFLSDDCRLVADAREQRLRSTSRTCVVTQTYSTFGDRAFAAAARVDYGTVFHRT